ncbi:hypothetical protein ScPMuIL_007735 [Solemya velum]
MSVLIATNPMMNPLTPVNSMPPMTPMTPLGPLASMQAMTPLPPINPMTALTPVSPVQPMGTAPDLFHLINYGDQNLGLLLSQRMELVWHGEFERLFSQYFPHTWYLGPATTVPTDKQWRTFKDSAKVRYSCQECGHGWTSMKGRVVFWFRLDYATNTGFVMFKLYGQQCMRCKNGRFEHAMWYPEEVVKVIGNVYNRVGQFYYGFVQPPMRIDRRIGKPRNQHNAELCQACKEGLCREEWSFSS